MTYSLDTIRCLIAHDSQDEAEQLMNALRNVGRITRAELALDEDSLVRAVKSGGWELLLTRPKFGDCDYKTVLGHLQRLAKKIPVLVLVDTFDAVALREALDAGASAICPAADRELLMLLVDREVEQVRLKKELLEIELSLTDAERRLSVLMDQSRDAIAYVLDGMHVHANDAYLEMFGYESADDLAGVPVMDMVSSGDHDKLKKLLRSRAQDESQTHELECRGVRTDGEEFDATFVFAPSSYDGEACTQIVIRAQAGMNDEEVQQKLHQMSLVDQITGLYNRSWFTEQLDKAVVAAVKKGAISMVLYMRLDEFEKHQSEAGIEGGDELLKKVAETLRNELGEGVPLARVVGEDFAALIPLSDPEEAAERAESVRKTMADLMPAIVGRTLDITVSIGCAFVREDSRGSQAVLTKALECCNRAQKANDGAGNHVYVHNPLDDVQSGSDEAVLLAVRGALENGKFCLTYQPIMNLQDEHEHFFEVFLTLPQQDGETLKPERFMAVANEHGLAGKIDRWVILQSMKAAMAQQESVRLLVNLSVHSLQDASLIDWIGKAMKAARFSGKNLVFQFSEADAATYLKQVAAFGEKVRQLDCGLSISRFGSGLNPSRILEHVPAITMVKCEGSYTQEMEKPEGKEKLAQLLQQIVDMDRLPMVGFVESASQMQTLWTLGLVRYLQGYYLQAPSPEIQVAAPVEE